jgi:DNA-directed RNA polymerase specialized sigma24 family protein
VAAGDLAEVLVERMEAQRQVAVLRGCLTAVEMEALVLQSVHQLSIAEIGQVMGRSGRAIESLLHRARTKARERLVHDA